MVEDFAPILQSVSHYNYNQCTQSKSLLVYQAWLRNSFNGYVDQYAFIELEGIIAGLITLKNKQDFGRNSRISFLASGPHLWRAGWPARFSYGGTLLVNLKL